MSDTETIKPEAEKDFVIIVNGQEKTVPSDEVTFDKVVILAFGAVDPNTVYTITYRHAKAPEHEGIMVEGGIVTVKERTVFNVTATTRS
ncbi:multiubiquitin domain-containing protein [Ferrimicrobium sp.]|uniref:multiubiquitin domain-containing protein n=1 Tax=Ferrimicrobium sp. TaxID=2926050 RepID=UPI002630A160|nr:multiubiquitin domain-containing protein [Ferrimicrobium sp.]